MHWLFLFFALACFAVVFKTTSLGVAALCLLLALVFALAWVMGLVNARVASRTRDEVQMVDPAELRRLREQAQARKPPPSAP
ncbi:hypothetical protein [Rehaibacterium terrae]|jgi:hypothetical protein|uniref:Uncharacterized protein n=1 Tax=Rehaibacterium terrae TaxID=1341696 RepID=A0A7W7XZX4_9GAMM|nr:hypothetical protein [Rehaibacterium terrae]MBB5015515.1 hypothetical protein [Rehaibacterium terrae]